MKIIRKVLICLSGLLMFYTVICIRLSIKEVSYYLPGLLGIYILLMVLIEKKYYKYKNIKIIRVMRNIMRICMIYFIVTFTIMCFSIYLCSNSNRYIKYDAIVVLGGELNGMNVSKSLAGRLNVAYDFWKNNSNIDILVSGGEKKDEKISEALAMHNYLLSKGVPSDKIIIENKSMTTIENMINSKKILDKRFIKNYRVIIATSDYHLLRARICARGVGLKTGGISSRTEVIEIPRCYLREYFAYHKMFFMDITKTI